MSTHPWMSVAKRASERADLDRVRAARISGPLGRSAIDPLFVEPALARIGDRVCPRDVRLEIEDGRPVEHVDLAHVQREPVDALEAQSRRAGWVQAGAVRHELLKGAGFKPE